VAFLPYINIPILYILEDIHVENRNVIINIVIESINSQVSTPPKGNLDIMTIGELKGNIDIQNARIPSGLFIIASIILNDRINGIVKGRIICCVSDSLSTAAPTQAKKELYNK